MVVEVNLRAAVGKTKVAKKEVVTSATEGQDLGLQGPTRRICLVCKSKASSYTCPRCGMPYCSSACYKNHGTGCTEGFYRDHIERELRVEEKETKPRVFPTTTPMGGGGGGGRQGEEEEEEGGQYVDEEQYRRLEALSQAERLDVDQLTEEEHMAFRRALLSGELGKMVEMWEPWWLSLALNSQGQPLITEEQSTSTVSGLQAGEEEDQPIDISSLWHQSRSITPLSSFPRVPPPSPSLPIHLIDLLFSYTYVCRVFNGAWSSDALQACSDLLSCSTVLHQCLSLSPPATMGLKTVRGAISECCAAIRQRSQGPTMIDRNTALGFAQDVAAILRAKVLVVAALCDIFNIVLESMVELLKGPAHGEGQETPNTTGVSRPSSTSLEDVTKWLEGLEAPKFKGAKKRLRELERCLRKLLYFMGWAKEMEESELVGWRAKVLETMQDLLSSSSWEGEAPSL